MNPIRIILPLILFFLSIDSKASKNITYDWLTLGEKSGEQIVSYENDKQLSIKFSFNDRGRGPDTIEKITLNDNGQMIKYSVTGNSYMGATVDEFFRLEGNIAKWRSDGVDGSKTVTQPFAYVAANGTPQTMAIMAKYLIKKADKKTNLLPSGQASIEQILTTTVTHKNQKKDIKLMAIIGLGMTPSYIWLEQDNTLFGVAYGWMGMTPQGWGEVLSQLQSLQDEAQQKYHQKLATKLTTKLAPSALIKNINFIDVINGKFRENTQVLIENGTIKAIGKDIAQDSAQQIIDGKGKTLMPGLWDMHAHVSLADGLLNIAAGITSVRDLANNHDELMQTIESYEQGKTIGPHVYKAGFIDKKSPYSAPTGKLAETLDDALTFVDWYAKRGYPQIKIYSSIAPEWVKPIAQRIHEHGMRLSGHIPSFMTTEQAVKDGYDEIQHINMVFLNFLAGPDDDTRTPLRFSLVGDKAGSLDLNSKDVTDFLKLLKEKNIVIDPTVTIFHTMFLNKLGELDPSYAMIAEHMPTSIKRSFLASTMDINEDNEKNYRESAQALLNMIKKLHDTGIQLVAGSDALVGFTIHRELELYHQAGISTKDIIKIATIDSAKVAGQASKTGSIEVGKDADLILIDGNPLDDISDIRKVIWTIKDHKLYHAPSLHQSVGIKPFVSAPHAIKNND